MKRLTRIFTKIKKGFLYLFNPAILWNWHDFGLMFRIYMQNEFANYYFAIDIQIAWLNLWIQCWKKNE